MSNEPGTGVFELTMDMGDGKGPIKARVPFSRELAHNATSKLELIDLCYREARIVIERFLIEEANERGEFVD